LPTVKGNPSVIKFGCIDSTDIHFLDAIGDGVGAIDLLASFGLFGATASL
jgi:hypothetical protein